jgi:hypothetical protein
MAFNRSLPARLWNCVDGVWDAAFGCAICDAVHVRHVTGVRKRLSGATGDLTGSQEIVNLHNVM